MVPPPLRRDRSSERKHEREGTKLIEEEAEGIGKLNDGAALPGMDDDLSRVLLQSPYFTTSRIFLHSTTLVLSLFTPRKPITRSLA